MAAEAAPTTAPAPLAVSAAPAALVQEPLYAEIVARAKGLRLRLKSAEASPGAATDINAFRAEVEALAALDMQGHFDLKARNVDGDLKCILKGIAEDLPKRLEDLAAATDAQARTTALKEMAYLLNDNVEVVSAPPGPATPPPAS
jgi:hypothetical protein